MEEKKFNTVFKSVSDFFSVLSNPDRVKILSLILKKEMDVTEIHESLGISQSRISQHLKLLKLQSLVKERREGKHVYYQVRDTRVSKVIEAAIQFQMLALTDNESLHLLHELFTHLHI